MERHVYFEMLRVPFMEIRIVLLPNWHMAGAVTVPEPANTDLLHSGSCHCHFLLVNSYMPRAMHDGPHYHVCMRVICKPLEIFCEY